MMTGKRVYTNDKYGEGTIVKEVNNTYIIKLDVPYYRIGESPRIIIMMEKSNIRF